MIRIIRSAVVLFYFVLFGLGAGVISFVLFPLGQIFVKKERRKLYYSNINHYSWKFLTWLFIVTGVIKLDVENKEKIHITGKVSSYLYKGVYNTCLEYFKHIKVERNYSEQISTYNNDEWLQISDNNNPESMLIVQEMANEIENAIKILPEQCRRILLLWDEGLSYQEIAKKMGVSAGTVSKQLNRVFVKIRNHLKIKGKQKY